MHNSFSIAISIRLSSFIVPLIAHSLPPIRLLIAWTCSRNETTFISFILFTSFDYSFGEIRKQSDNESFGLLLTPTLSTGSSNMKYAEDTEDMALKCFVNRKKGKNRKNHQRFNQWTHSSKHYEIVFTLHTPSNRWLYAFWWVQKSAYIKLRVMEIITQLKLYKGTNLCV